jgi:uncharacterized protein (DUF58 family)
MADRHRYKYLDPAALHRLGRLPLVARSVVEGFFTGLHRSPYHGFSIEFAEHREYVPGDDLRHLDWRTLARTDRRYIKQYEEETNLKAYILLDVSASMGYCSKPDANLTKLEYASFLAACLAYIMMKQTDPVGLVLFDEDVQEFIPPASAPAHLNQILRKLEEVKPSRKTRASAAFHRVADRLRRRGLAIILSDLFDDPMEVLRGLQHFRFRKHEVILFHILDQAELEFPFGQLMDFVDMETGERIQIDPNFVRTQYVAEIADFIGRIKKNCLENGIDYERASTATPYDQMLFAYLYRRDRLSK